VRKTVKRKKHRPKMAYPSGKSHLLLGQRRIPPGEKTFAQRLGETRGPESKRGESFKRTGNGRGRKGPSSFLIVGGTYFAV